MRWMFHSVVPQLGWHCDVSYVLHAALLPSCLPAGLWDQAGVQARVPVQVLKQDVQASMGHPLASGRRLICDVCLPLRRAPLHPCISAPARQAVEDPGWLDKACPA